jgi:hypothetical protein
MGERSSMDTLPSATEIKTLLMLQPARITGIAVDDLRYALDQKNLAPEELEKRLRSRQSKRNTQQCLFEAIQQSIVHEAGERQKRRHASTNPIGHPD